MWMSDFPVKQRRGFTLLEVMVAVSIIAIVSTAVYQLHISTLSQSHQGRVEGTCLLLAEKKLAELNMASLKASRSAQGDFGEDFPDFRWEVELEDIESEIFGAAGNNLKRIDLRVFSSRASVFFATRVYRIVD